MRRLNAPLAQSINQGRGTLGRLVQDPTTAKALEGSLQNLESVTARLRAGEGSLGQLLNNDAFAKSLTSTTTNIDTLTARLNRGEGTAGKLITDASLFNRLNSMSERLDKVVAQLQEGQGTAADPALGYWRGGQEHAAACHMLDPRSGHSRSGDA